VVFAGDTAFQDGFKELRRRGTLIDLAILPIGGYIPHHDNHCTPEEALIMADHMDAKHILPVHWGTFPGEEGLTEPIERLRRAIVAQERIVIDEIGQTWVREESK
jgi:L-ascorbate metabolism protein UlaG (beta-lactamase superfamily)